MDIHDVVRAVKNIDESSPCLFIAGAAKDFRERYKKRIISLRTVEEVREFRASYEGISAIDGTLVIDDLGFMSEQAIAALLKFVEDTKLKLVILATFDKTNPIFCSRIRTIVKYSEVKTSSEFMPVSIAKDKIDQELSEDTSFYDRMRKIVEYSPLIYYWDKRLEGTSNKQKILNIMGV